MTSDDFASYKHLLDEEKSRLETTLQRLTAGSEHLKYVRRAIYQRLKEIESAQERFADGTYGGCINCGQPILPERLRNVPHTAYCLACQLLSESGNDSSSASI